MHQHHGLPRRLSCLRLFLILVVGMPSATASAGAPLADDIQQTVLKRRAEYAAALDRLAQWCESNGLSEEARKTRRILSPTDPYKLYVPILPDEVGPQKLPDDAPPNVVEWNKRLIALRTDQAQALFDAARRAVRGGNAGLAFELLLAALQANPDLEPARRALGYQKYQDRWCTVYEMKKLKAGQVWDDEFGWLPKSHLARYRQGQRFLNGRWISAEDDAKRHGDIRSGWEVETEHYRIRTNHSLQAAVALGGKLERLNRLWRQIFIRYYASESDVAAMFEGRARQTPSAAARHDVVLFRDRDEYNRSLKPTMPNIGISIGVYVDRTRCAYFFVGPDSDDRTLYHEATHQLFHESRPVASDVARKANFWIVEGIALFMESLRQEEGYCVLGGYDDERLHAARYRLLHDGFYVPLREFTAYGMERLQNDPRIATLYSQAAGLTNFLVFHDKGRYRGALVAYLTAVYTGRADADTLARLVAEDYGSLDTQYRQFLDRSAP